jgi:hypothetical protein
MKNLSKVNKFSDEEQVLSGNFDITSNTVFSAGINGQLTTSGIGSGGGNGVGGGGSGHGGGGSGNGGGSGGGGSTKGDLFGDQYVLLRDLDPTDGGGQGEPVLDLNGQPILIGTNGEPIYFIKSTEGDYEIPADDLMYVQTVELGRANVARAPTKVMEKSLSSALDKIDAGTNVSIDISGRIVVDDVTIDSPLENLALYKYLMTAGGASSWPEVVQNWPSELKALVGNDLLNPNWSPASLLGAAFDKSSPISLDAVLYENSVLGVNKVSYLGGEMQVDYFDFGTQNTESFNYDRASVYNNIWLQWYEDIDGDLSNLELVQKSVMDAIFQGSSWSDEYITVTEDGQGFKPMDADSSGLNDFAQAVDDARAVINFMHETGATELDLSSISPMNLVSTEGQMLNNSVNDLLSDSSYTDDSSEIIFGSNQSDELIFGGGSQTIYGENGKDVIYSGGGPDFIMGGNGKDYLAGEGGPDLIDGGNGDDVIYGGAGPDVLTGGNGHDIFVYQSKGDAAARGNDSDGGHDSGHTEFNGMSIVFSEVGNNEMRLEQITDFSPEEDLIYLRYMGVISFSDEPAENSVWAEQQGANAIVRADLNGEIMGAHGADLEITLIGVNSIDISASNFLF